MFCNQCGSENRNDRKFCANCGAPLQDYTQPKKDLIMPEDVAKEQQFVFARNNIKKMCNIIVAIFFALAITFLIVSFFVEGVVFWVCIGCAIFFYLAMLITIIATKKVIKNLKTKK